jgi:hypothetical protein
MGGFGSGRRGGRPTVESAFRIDIDVLRRHGMIRLGSRDGCVMHFSGYYDDLDVKCEVHIKGQWNSWIRLKYDMIDYRTDEPLEIDDKIRCGIECARHSHRPRCWKMVGGAGLATAG